MRVSHIVGVINSAVGIVFRIIRVRIVNFLIVIYGILITKTYPISVYFTCACLLEYLSFIGKPISIVYLFHIVVVYAFSTQFNTAPAVFLPYTLLWFLFTSVTFICNLALGEPFTPLSMVMFCKKTELDVVCEVKNKVFCTPSSKQLYL